MGIITHSPLYFTPEEVVKLGKNQGATGTLEIVRDIEKAWGTQYENPLFNHECMLSAIFEAGYIQGKREERKRVADRKRKAKAKELELYRTSEVHGLRSIAKHYIDQVDTVTGVTMMKDLCYTIWHSWKFKGKYQDN